MIRTVFTTTTLIPVNMPGFVPCVGLEMVNNKGESVIVGVEDIIASDYTWQTIVRDGLTLYPLILPVYPDTPKASILMQFMVSASGKFEFFDFENTIRAVDDELLEALTNRQTRYTPERLKEIRDRLKGQIMDINRKFLDKTLQVRARLSNFVGGDDNMLRNYQATHFPGTYTDLVMERPEDTVSLKIPAYERLRNIYFRDARAQAVVDALETGDTEDEAESSGSERTAVFGQFDMGTTNAPVVGLNVEFFEDLESKIDVEHFPVGMGYPYYDSYRYAQCSLTSGMSYIAGNIVGFDENNDAPVPYPNEEGYYRGLQGLIRQGLQEENDFLTIDEVEQAIASGRHSKIVDSYLQDMSKQAFALGRRHTGHVTYSVVLSGGQNEDDDSEDEIGMEIQGMYTIDKPEGHDKYVKVPLSPETMQQLQSEYLIFDGFEPLKSYVENYAWGADAWAKVLIILLRFGNRKPRLLHVSGRDPEKKMYFDLEQSKMTERNTNKASWKPKLFDDGSEYELYGFINWNGHATDMQAFKSYFGVGAWAENMTMPIGVVLTKYYEGISDPEFTFVDLFTFVEIVRHNRHKISGVTFNEGADQPIQVNVTDEMMNLSVAEMKSYLGRNSDMVILYVNMDLKMQYNRLAQSMREITSKPPEVSIQNYHLFNIVDALMQANPLTAYMELAQIIGSTDGQKIAALVTGHNITAERAHLPIVNYVSIEKTSLLLSLTEELYEANMNAKMWTPSQILSMAYKTFTETPKGKTSMQIQEDKCRTAFVNCVKTFGKYSPIMKNKKCVGFLASGRNREGLLVFCIWVINEWEIPPEEKRAAPTELSVVLSKIYSIYVKYKNAGKLDQLVNRQLFMANATTMETLAKM